MADTNKTDMNQPVRTAQFNASIGQEQLSYICAHCGKVNPITAGKCLRCGKRRPRNEYLRVINKSKQAQDFRESLSNEMAQLELDRKEAQDMQLVRLVEERVADEKASIEAQAAIKREQDIDAVQRLAARDAALRVIEAERRAEEAIAGKARETEEQLRIEREKALYAAAKKIVSERAGIEQAAEERINIARAEIQKEADRSLTESVNTVEKDAARRAVMKVIAAEQSAEDRIRLERESSQRAAMERIKEETERIAQYEQAKHDAEKEGIQRAVEERLRAEREIFGRGGEAYAAGSPYPMQQSPVQAPPQYPHQNPMTIQPLAIVPYLNGQQPLFQYDPNQVRTVYKFIPDAPVEEEEQETDTQPLTFAPVKKQKKGGVRFLGFLQTILSAIILFFVFFKTELLGDILLGGGEPLAQIKSLLNFGSMELTSLIFPGLWALIVIMAVASLIQGLVRLFGGKISKGSWAIGLILFLFILGAYGVFFFTDFAVVAGVAGTVWLFVIYLGISFIILFASVIAEMVRIKRK